MFLFNKHIGRSKCNIFQSYFVGILSALFAVALNIIELLVAAIQAYVFTMFSSVYIGLAIEEEH